jgi:glutathione peroxidase
VKQILKPVVALLLAVVCGSAMAQKTDSIMATIYDYKAIASNGKEIDFKQFEGKVLLIVNTASKCGFTPQFDGLEALNEKYRDRGLVVLGFPCNQFAEQDPAADSEIEGFCRMNYGVTFQIMKKSDVNGDDEHPVFTFLKAQAPAEEYKGLKAKATHTLLKGLSKSAKKEGDILWNFTKFLVAKDGTTVQRFAPTTEPKDIEKAIEAML